MQTLGLGVDARAWLDRLDADRVWLEADWTLLAGGDRWALDDDGGLVRSAATDATTASHPSRPPVDVATAEVLSAIAANADVARRIGDAHWAAYFDRARSTAASDSELLAPHTSPGARRLCGLVSAAWAFGGMGSWNDVVLDDAGAAARGRLYGALITGLVAAANE